MRLLPRRPAAVAPEPLAFGEWVLRCFLAVRESAALPFPELERAAASTASVLCAAVYAGCEAALPAPGPGVAEEARLVATRTADGFRAALADRAHTVIVWPWDHIATLVAWEVVRTGEAEPAALGRRLSRLAAAYALHHQEQLELVLGLWSDVASALPGAPRRTDLLAMARELHEAYALTRPAAARR